MNAKNTFEVLTSFPVEESILIIGKHGIGKSQIVKQAAKYLGVPCIDFRLSQNDVGDLKGMPFHKNGRTIFAPPEFMPITEKDATELKGLLGIKEEISMGRFGDKGILFLDEINRANREVQQAAFELVLDRRMNLRALPDGWRVVSAVNDDDDIYNVNSLDPAFLSRFFVIPFDPSQEEWFDWAEGTPMKIAKISEEVLQAAQEAWNGIKNGLTIHPAIVEFLRRYPDFIDPTTELLKEASSKGITKVHDRRAWDKFSRTLHKLISDQSVGARADEPLSKAAAPLNFLTMVAQGFVGHLAAVKFRSFIETDYQALDAATILNKWSDAVEKQIKDITAKGRIPELATYNDALCAHIKKHIKDKMNPTQKKNLSKYLSLIPKETVADIWQKLNSECKTVSEDWYMTPGMNNGDLVLGALVNPDKAKRGGCSGYPQEIVSVSG